MPMKQLAGLASLIDAINETIGRAVSWLALTMVLVTFTLVVMRYVFGLASIALQESVIYMHGLLFMLAAGYTLLHDGHVRVDIFYREARARTKAWVNLLGVLFFLIPVCGLIWYASWSYVAQSWSVHEGSRETSGIQAVFLLKTVILVFVAQMILQGLALAARSIIVLMGGPEPQGPGGVTPASTAERERSAA